jgi:hypothetical protein
MIANDRFTKNEISATISTNTNRYGNAIAKNVIYEKRSGEMYALQHEMRNKATRKKQQALQAVLRKFLMQWLAAQI